MWYSPAYPVSLLEATYKGPKGDAYRALIESVWQEGVLNPLLGISDGQALRVTTGKQRLEVCNYLGIELVPVVIWDTSNMLPDTFGEWSEIRTREEGQELFPLNYEFSMSPRGFKKVLEEDYEDHNSRRT